MNIAILGHGKMGKRIRQLAIKKGHNIVATSNSKNPTELLDLSNADVAIDFSTPKSAFKNISYAINNNTPVISGTTGWLNHLSDIHNLCQEKAGAFLYSSNFSLGANIFFKLNTMLAKLMKNQNYISEIHETHHTEKIDSPSGTAIHLESQIKNILNTKAKITSRRIKKTTGIHQITYTSELDKIEIKHTANNRDGFAIGAIIAAEWIIGKTGVYNMKDVLTI